MSLELNNFSVNRSDLNPNTVRDVHALRYDVFFERLQWEVGTEQNLEIDEYDALDPVYVIAKQGRSVAGCMRLLPTLGPYMLKDTFPEVLCGETAPEAKDVFEISRYAVDSRNISHDDRGISNISLSLLRSAYFYATRNHIRQYVMVTTVAIERYLRKLGIHVERFGNQQSVYLGKERSVALKMNIDESFYQAICHC